MTQQPVSFRRTRPNVFQYVCRELAARSESLLSCSNQWKKLFKTPIAKSLRFSIGSSSVISQNLHADHVSKTLIICGPVETNSPNPLPFHPAQERFAWLRVDLLRRSRLVVLLYHVDVKLSAPLVRPIEVITVIARAVDEVLALPHDDGASGDVGWLRWTALGSAGGDVWSKCCGRGESHSVRGRGREMDLILYD